MNSIFKSLIPKTVRSLSTLGSVNQVTLVGLVSSDPKILVKESEKTTVFSLETIRYVERNEDGIDLHRVVVNEEKLNNFIEKFKMVKGDQVYVNGRIQNSRISDSDGNFRYVTFIDAKNISIMSRNRNNQVENSEVINEATEKSEVKTTLIDDDNPEGVTKKEN